MDKNYVVKKSNYFIMNCSYDLSLEEQKLILTLASMVQPNDEDFKPYKFKIADFMKLLGVDTKTKYTEVPKITKELMKKVFEIEEDDTLIQTAWLSSATYKKGSGMVEIEFSPKLKPYMLKLNGLFTQYKLANILSMKSKYSPRIYEILKCNEFKQQGYIEIELEELRKLLKADNVYPKYNDFKRYILERTQKELKKISDISFNFEEIKTGRKVTSIKFFIKANKKVNAPKKIAVDIDTTKNDIIKLVELMKDHDITYREAESIYKSGNANLVHIAEVYDYFKNKSADNFIGLMVAQVKPGVFNKPKQSQNQTSFNNFEPRQYDYTELEKKLLGWDN
ncbi:replication initiation protein [Clostridium sp. ZBS13]|uniref:replication initiation protein n=1 Tax=Clostridium sp. ZBS13 TaxID=2949971 RepID=UPI00207A86C7|nr:replication initiation protein [Clostridium sp. ZBS13]